MIFEDIMFALRKALRPILKRFQYALMRNVRARSPEEKRILAEGSRILANSIPKAGTNLLSRTIEMMPNTVDRWTYHIDETLPGIKRQLSAGKRGQIVTAHLPWTPKIASTVSQLDYRVLLMIRDPRDIAVSVVNYVYCMDLSHPLHRALTKLPDDDARLLFMIEPPEEVTAELPDIWKNSGLATFMPWIDEPSCLTVRFEDLVGAQGGGNEERQRKIIQAIAVHIGANSSSLLVEKIRQDLFGNNRSKTFHKGQIGGWKQHFKSAHKAAFKRHYSHALVRLGYETGSDW